SLVKWGEEIYSFLISPIKITPLTLIILFLLSVIFLRYKKKIKNALGKNYRIIEKPKYIDVTIDFGARGMVKRKEKVIFYLGSSTPEYTSYTVTCGKCEIRYEEFSTYPLTYQCPNCGKIYGVTDYNRIIAQARSKLIKEVLPQWGKEAEKK
ncbi:unnamed protein product, partial [marine sediment metagenome]